MDKASRFCFITAIAIGCLMSFALAANSRFSSFNFFGGDQSTNNAYMFSQFYAAAVDPVDNSVYLYGHSTLALNNNLTSPRGSVDVVLIKLLSNGSVGWSKTIGGSDNDLSIMAAHFWHGKNIAIDPQSRDVVIQGNTQSPIFEGEPKVSAGNNWDAFLIRYHRNGTLIAMTIYGQTGSHVMPTDLFIYGNETYVVGSNYGGFAGSSFVGWWSAFLFRFRLMVIEGQLKLNPSFLKPVFLIGESPTNSHTFGYAIDIWNDTVHIAGSTAGNMPGYMNMGDYDIFISRFTLGGVLLNGTIQIGSGGADTVFDMKVRDNFAYIAGFGSDAINIPGVGMLSQQGLSNEQLIAKVPLGNNSTGGWGRLIGGNSADWAHSIEFHPLSGNLYVSGLTQNYLTTPPNTPSQEFYGGTDLTVSLFTQDGQYIWTEVAGSSGGLQDWCRGAVFNSAGMLYLVGHWSNGAGYLTLNQTGNNTELNRVNIVYVAVTVTKPATVYSMITAIQTASNDSQLTSVFTNAYFIGVCAFAVIMFLVTLALVFYSTKRSEKGPGGINQKMASSMAALSVMRLSMTRPLSMPPQPSAIPPVPPMQMIENGSMSPDNRSSRVLLDSPVQMSTSPRATNQAGMNNASSYNGNGMHQSNSAFVQQGSFASLGMNGDNGYGGNNQI